MKNQNPVESDMIYSLCLIESFLQFSETNLKIIPGTISCSDIWQCEQVPKPIGQEEIWSCWNEIFKSNGRIHTLGQKRSSDIREELCIFNNNKLTEYKINWREHIQRMHGIRIPIFFKLQTWRKYRKTTNEMGRRFPGGWNSPRGLSLIVDDDDDDHEPLNNFTKHQIILRQIKKIYIMRIKPNNWS